MNLDSKVEEGYASDIPVECREKNIGSGNQHRSKEHRADHPFAKPSEGKEGRRKSDSVKRKTPE